MTQLRNTDVQLHDLKKHLHMNIGVDSGGDGGYVSPPDFVINYFVPKIILGLYFVIFLNLKLNLAVLLLHWLHASLFITLQQL